MNNRLLTGMALLLLLGTPLAAEEVRYGVAINVAAPTGAFNTTNYPANAFNQSPTQESYNGGGGADFLVVVPMNRVLALRFRAGFESFSGSATSAGYYSLNLSDQMVSLGGVAQIFFGNGNAARQTGTYMLAGACVDMEQFGSSYGDPEYNPSSTTSKTRFAGEIGAGHTFRSRWGGRYFLEASYHKTLTTNNVNAGDPPSADFVKFNFGFIF